MRLFLRVCDADGISRYAALGVLGGVYLTPSELPSLRQKDTIFHLSSKVDTVWLRVTGSDTAQILRECRSLAGYGSKVAISLPFSGESLRAIRALKSDGVATCIREISSLERGVLASLAGADYLGPPPPGDLPSLLPELSGMLRRYHFSSKIIAEADSPPEFAEVIRQGSDAAILPPELLDRLLLP